MDKSESSKKVEEIEFSNEEQNDLKQIFDFFDVNGIGRIEPKKLKEALLSQGFDKKSHSIYQFFADLDTPENEKKGGISFEEFLNVIKKKYGDKDSEEGIKNIFDLFIDNPNSNAITLDSLKKISKELGEKLTDDELEEMLDRLSNNSYGITFEEFRDIMKQ